MINRYTQDCSRKELVKQIEQDIEAIDNADCQLAFCPGTRHLVRRADVTDTDYISGRAALHTLLLSQFGDLANELPQRFSLTQLQRFLGRVREVNPTRYKQTQDKKLPESKKYAVAVSEIDLSDMPVLVQAEVVDFLEAVYALTADKHIDLPGSKHHGKKVSEYRQSMADSIDFPHHPTSQLRDEDDFSRLCGHGTNLYAALLAIAVADCNLIPGAKQQKLFGKPQSGESQGETPLNLKFVSAVSLDTENASFAAPFKYAQRAISVNKKNRDDFARQILKGKKNDVLIRVYEQLSQVPVVIIGLGESRIEGRMIKAFANETAFKRVKLQTVAVPNEAIKRLLMELVGGLGVQDPLRVVTLKDLQELEALRERPYQVLELERVLPDDSPVLLGLEGDYLDGTLDLLKAGVEFEDDTCTSSDEDDLTSNSDDSEK